MAHRHGMWLRTLWVHAYEPRCSPWLISVAPPLRGCGLWCADMWQSRAPAAQESHIIPGSHSSASAAAAGSRDGFARRGEERGEKRGVVGERLQRQHADIRAWMRARTHSLTETAALLVTTSHIESWILNLESWILNPMTNCVDTPEQQRMCERRQELHRSSITHTWTNTRWADHRYKSRVGLWG